MYTYLGAGMVGLGLGKGWVDLSRTRLRYLLGHGGWRGTVVYFTASSSLYISSLEFVFPP